eukprot:6187797-Alexandrium_andersonii.AAC.1
MGPRLFRHLAGEAFAACEHLDLEELCKKDGHKLILKELDGYYKLTESGEVADACDEFFELQRNWNETVESFAMRAKNARRRMEAASDGMTLSDGLF